MSRSLRKSPFAIAILVVLFGAIEPAAAFTLYTDRATFEAALGSTVTETFSSNVGSADTITFPEVPILSVGTGPGPGGSNLNRVLGGSWDGRIRNAGGSSGFLSIVFDFPNPVSGFAADWAGIDISPGVRLSGDFDGTGVQVIDLHAALGNTTFGFLGVIGDVEFSAISLTVDAALAGDDLIKVDDLTITAPVAPVPALPRPWSALFAIAMLATGTLCLRARLTGEA